MEEGFQMRRPEQEKADAVWCSQLGQMGWELSQRPKQPADYRKEIEAEKASWENPSQIPYRRYEKI